MVLSILTPAAAGEWSKAQGSPVQFHTPSTPQLMRSGLGFAIRQAAQQIREQGMGTATRKPPGSCSQQVVADFRILILFFEDSFACNYVPLDAKSVQVLSSSSQDFHISIPVPLCMINQPKMGRAQTLRERTCSWIINRFPALRTGMTDILTQLVTG